MHRRSTTLSLARKLVAMMMRWTMFCNTKLHAKLTAVLTIGHVALRISVFFSFVLFFDGQHTPSDIHTNASACRAKMINTLWICFRGRGFQLRAQQYFYNKNTSFFPTSQYEDARQTTVARSRTSSTSTGNGNSRQQSLKHILHWISAQYCIATNRSSGKRSQFFPPTSKTTFDLTIEPTTTNQRT